MNFLDITEKLRELAEQYWQIDGIAVVGSYANATYRPDSDVDICVFTSDPRYFLDHLEWLNNFGEVARFSKERWGVVETLRVFYQDGWELEFNFSALSWADIPVDQGTLRVAAGGLMIVYDPTNQLRALKNHLSPPS